MKGIMKDKRGVTVGLILAIVGMLVVIFSVLGFITAGTLIKAVPTWLWIILGIILLWRLGR